MLASGSFDTDLILWDVVGEAGLYRLRGHKDQVTDLVRMGAGGAETVAEGHRGDGGAGGWGLRMLWARLHFTACEATRTK